METNVKERRKKRVRTAEEDLGIYKEYISVPNGKKAEYLRNKGLYPTDIARIENTVEVGALQALKDRKSRKKVKLVPESEIEIREAVIREHENTIASLAHEVIVLKKKVNGTY